MRHAADIGARSALDSLPRVDGLSRRGFAPGVHHLNVAADRPDANRAPLRDHVATSVRRYLLDLNGSGTDDLYNIALRELEIPLFAEVLQHCDGNQSRAASMLGIHRATLRKKLKDYGLSS